MTITTALSTTSWTGSLFCTLAVGITRTEVAEPGRKYKIVTEVLDYFDEDEEFEHTDYGSLE